MTLGFAPGARRGRHYELARFAVNKLKKVNLLVTGSTENAFEHTITSSLQSSPKLSRNLIAGIDKNEVEKITPANLFGFSHKPDLSIGIDGTAIEIKMVSSGQGVRDLIGQAITYRMHYRFVILVLIDQTKDKRLVKLCRSKKTQEFKSSVSCPS